MKNIKRRYVKFKESYIVRVIKEEFKHPLIKFVYVPVITLIYLCLSLDVIFGFAGLFD